MSFWEQLIIGFVITLLKQLKIDPARLPVFQEVLTDIYNGIAELEGWPMAPVTTPAPPPVIPPKPGN
jgi:hypothetical protein